MSWTEQEAPTAQVAQHARVRECTLGVLSSRLPTLAWYGCGLCCMLVLLVSQSTGAVSKPSRH